MSLDVYLIQKEVCEHCGHETGDGTEVYSANITHNLVRMAEAAGIYKALWYPDDDEVDASKAKHLVPFLEQGIDKLKSDPAHFRRFNATNNWGTYDDFVPFVEKYLKACKEYPEAYVSVSR